MFYIHQSSCISPQQTFKDADLTVLHGPVEKQLKAIEPTYDAIPPGVLRRMGKAVRMGAGTALPLLQEHGKTDGIIIATANAGKEDCVKFLDQIVQYEEGMLTPLNFVQSTPNAIAGQLGLITKNHGYNITHLHQGLAFENALMDADMRLAEYPDHQYLLGAVDDISVSSYTFEEKEGWHKQEDISNKDLYNADSPGSIAGEAAVMFLVNNIAAGAKAKLVAVDTLHSTDEHIIKERLTFFIQQHLQNNKADLLLSGEDGDNRLAHFYDMAAAVAGNETPIARYKHMCGAYPTASAFGLWIACEILKAGALPEHMTGSLLKVSYKKILLYNSYRGYQHSFMLVSVA